MLKCYFRQEGVFRMPISCTTHERTLQAAISGEVDHHGAKAIMRELEQQIDRALPLELIVDCSGVTFMDSSGIAVLLRARQRLEPLGGKMYVRSVPTQAAKVLKAAGLDRLITFD